MTCLPTHSGGVSQRLNGAYGQRDGGPYSERVGVLAWRSTAHGRARLKAQQRPGHPAALRGDSP